MLTLRPTYVMHVVFRYLDPLGLFGEDAKAMATDEFLH